MPHTSRACHFAARLSRKRCGYSRQHRESRGFRRTQWKSGACRSLHAHVSTFLFSRYIGTSVSGTILMRSIQIALRQIRLKHVRACLFAVRRWTAYLHRSRIRYDRGRHNTGDGCARFLLSAGCWAQTKACDESNFTSNRRNAVTDYEPVKTSGGSGRGLSTPVRFWVKSGPLRCKKSCPLYPLKRTCACNQRCPLWANSGRGLIRSPRRRARGATAESPSLVPLRFLS